MMHRTDSNTSLTYTFYTQGQHSLSHAIFPTLFLRCERSHAPHPSYSRSPSPSSTSSTTVLSLSSQTSRCETNSRNLETPTWIARSNSSVCSFEGYRINFSSRTSRFCSLLQYRGRTGRIEMGSGVRERQGKCSGWSASGQEKKGR
jgi:hypothetical protein